MTSASRDTDRHHVEADGYCTTCETVGCRAGRTGQRSPDRIGQLERTLKELTVEVRAIASALGVGVTCPACGARYRTAGACPACGAQPDAAPVV